MNSLESESPSRTVLMHAQRELNSAREQLLELCLQMQRQDAEHFETHPLSETVAAVRAAEANLHALRQLVKEPEDDGADGVASRAER